MQLLNKDDITFTFDCISVNFGLPYSQNSTTPQHRSFCKLRNSHHLNHCTAGTVTLATSLSVHRRQARRPRV